MARPDRMKDMERLLDITARVCDVPPVWLRSEIKAAGATRARFVAMWVAYHEYGISSPQIGRAVRRDHSTVLSGIKTAAALIEVQDGEFCRQVEYVTAIVRGERRPPPKQGTAPKPKKVRKVPLDPIEIPLLGAEDEPHENIQVRKSTLELLHRLRRHHPKCEVRENA